MIKREHLLAHRGVWREPPEKNSAAALQEALDRGFGIETDIRDLDGRLVIAHDPPTAETAPLTLDWLFEYYRVSGAGGVLALNIKADGLAQDVAELAARRQISALFVFDMSIPDTLHYFKAGLPVYSRVSEYEPTPAFPDRIDGVWLDGFTPEYSQVAALGPLRDAGRTVALVSPELHKRDYTATWTEWRDALARGPTDPPVMLCTDFPEEAERWFGA